MNPVILLLVLCLGACASPGNRKLPAPAHELPSNYSPRTIQIYTLPPGAIIDHNNDVIGVSPCQLQLPRCYNGQWPGTGYFLETLRARWIDGTMQEQTFVSAAPVPKRVAFIHPNPAFHYPPPPTLTQR